MSLVDELWDALRERCCVSGTEAKRIVMVSKGDVEAAVAAVAEKHRQEHEKFLEELVEMGKRPPPPALVELMRRVPIWEREKNRSE